MKKQILLLLASVALASCGGSSSSRYTATTSYGSGQSITYETALYKASDFAARMEANLTAVPNGTAIEYRRNGTNHMGDEYVNLDDTWDFGYVEGLRNFSERAQGVSRGFS